jgi:hypothetical protein
MTDIKVRLSKDGPFEVNDELAGLVPMADEVEQAVLTQDIADNGQQDPIVLWQGKVVDGRCRQKALTMIESHIMYRELADTLTEAEVRTYVKSVNTRRNLTHTQKVMSAVRDSLRPGSGSNIKIAKAWGISEGLIKNGKFIAKHRPEFIQPLFDGGSVNITGANGFDTTSNKVSTIYASIKRELEHAERDESHAWSDEAAIKTQEGKEWYYEFVKINKISDIPTKMALAELANYKFYIKVYNAKK